MVSQLLARVPKRQQDTLMSVLKPEGLLHLTNLLLAERDVVDRFELSYSTPALRRLEGKRRRGEATPEEEKTLNASAKEFTGRLKSGEEIKNKQAIAMVNQMMKSVSAVSQLVDTLAKSTKGGTVADTMILGERLSVLNLNPRLLIELVLNNIFNQPEWVLNEIKTLFALKTEMPSARVFKDIDALQGEFLKLGITSSDDTSFADLLSKIEVESGREVAAVGQVIRTLLMAAKKMDEVFDKGVYSEVKNHVPQYHCVNVKWIVWFLSSFVGSNRQYVASAISIEVLLAFYRKGVELTCLSST